MTAKRYGIRVRDRLRDEWRGLTFLKFSPDVDLETAETLRRMMPNPDAFEVVEVTE